MLEVFIFVFYMVSQYDDDNDDIYLLTLHISMLCASNQRSGWSSLVVTQPSTDHQLMCVQCVCVCVLLCLAIYYSGPSW